MRIKNICRPKFERFLQFHAILETAIGKEFGGGTAAQYSSRENSLFMERGLRWSWVSAGRLTPTAFYSDTA